jgi:hypothetical protein
VIVSVGVHWVELLYNAFADSAQREPAPKGATELNYRTERGAPDPAVITVPG